MKKKFGCKNNRKMIPPYIFFFEECTPEYIIYRLDYKNSFTDKNYIQMFEDYGWKYLYECIGWLYFRNLISKINNENYGEIFSDNEYKITMV